MLGMLVLLNSNATLMTEINVPGTFIDFWIFPTGTALISDHTLIRLAVKFTNWRNFETVIPISMSNHREVHLHSFNLSTKKVPLALTMKDQFHCIICF